MFETLGVFKLNNFALNLFCAKEEAQVSDQTKLLERN